ncbi:MAG: Polymer-forming cytoskeletal [Candidatus Latescibacteria bacterium ADurb.Bin168]|nr:MAG: Polymer-forming cytoskeletal [Candidatus Latescibacteria bacterium ADurb.Bin168]
MAKFQAVTSATINTIIGENSRVVGDFDIAGSIKVEGFLKGKLTTSERLVIGLGGVVLADANVRDAIIGGTFTGTLYAETRVEMESTAKVRGDVRTKQLVIHEGAEYEGNISRGEETSDEGEGDAK